jgi:hypothetical protein
MDMEQSGPEAQYDRAITLIQYYVQLMWFIFGAFLLAETVLLGAVASLAKEGPRDVLLGISTVGFLLAIPWWTSYRYNHSLYLLRVAEARSLEPGVGTFFTTGARLIDGNAIESVIGAIRIPWSARLLSPNRAVLALVALFLAAFGTLIVLCLFGHLPVIRHP